MRASRYGAKGRVLRLYVSVWRSTAVALRGRIFPRLEFIPLHLSILCSNSSLR